MLNLFPTLYKFVQSVVEKANTKLVKIKLQI